MRSKTPNDLPGRCENCYLLSAWCVCAKITKVDAPFSVVLLRHIREGYKTTNTGRIALLAINRSMLIDYGERGVSFDENLLGHPGDALLFPVRQNEPLWQSEAPPARLIVVDGTWAQASRMVNRISALRCMPRISTEKTLTTPIRLRQEKKPQDRSTLEAIADSLSLFSYQKSAETLYELYRTYTTHVLQSRGLSVKNV